MLLKWNRQVLFTGVAILFISVCILIYTNVDTATARSGEVHAWAKEAWAEAFQKSAQEDENLLTVEGPVGESGSHRLNVQYARTPFAAKTHHEVFSHLTSDGNYFLIKFGAKRAMNPSIIPHPTLPDRWYIVAQQYKTLDQNQAWFTELACIAAFNDTTLQCLEPPAPLPIPATSSSECRGDLEFFDDNIGPHDARVFHGPDRPYIMYGSQSQRNCFGLWMQDFRRVVDWKHDFKSVQVFRHATDLQRPGTYGVVEKNWFIFWSPDGQMYAHYDILPHRAFARLNGDGSAGEDLAPTTADADGKCMEKILGRDVAVPKDDMSWHQATNSLAITMCKRADAACKKTADNTFIMTIFQHKTYTRMHSVYEPYVMLMKQTAPFAVHMVSKKPIWIHGRRAPGEQDAVGVETAAARPPPDQSEMLYVTSMNWKDPGRGYYGYLDDAIFLGFGIEDSDTGGIDLLASDLLAQMGTCV